MALHPPNYIVGSDGRPTAVVVALDTWETIVARLEAQEDQAILRAAEADLTTLARGELPLGWKRWTDFEAELEAEEAGQ